MALSLPMTSLAQALSSLSMLTHILLGTIPLIPTSTDFRQFEQYLNVTGLDVTEDFFAMLSPFLFPSLDGRCW